MPRIIYRFLGVGALNTLLGISAFPVLYYLIGALVNVNVILVMSYLICTTFAFTMHKRVTFKTEGNHAPEAARFVLVSLGLLAVNALAMNLLLYYTTLHPVVIQMTLAVVLQVFNFALLRKLVFVEKPL